MTVFSATRVAKTTKKLECRKLSGNKIPVTKLANFIRITSVFCSLWSVAPVGFSLQRHVDYTFDEDDP